MDFGVPCGLPPPSTIPPLHLEILPSTQCGAGHSILVQEVCVKCAYSNSPFLTWVLPVPASPYLGPHPSLSVHCPLSQVPSLTWPSGLFHLT